MAIEAVMRKEKIKRGTAAYPQKERQACVRSYALLVGLLVARVFSLGWTHHDKAGTFQRKQTSWVIIACRLQRLYLGDAAHACGWVGCLPPARGPRCLLFETSA